MLFSSLTFLYYYLPVVLVVYFLAPSGWRNGILVAASLFFYAWGEPKYVLLMGAFLLCGYGFGLALGKSRGTRGGKGLLALAVGVNLALLGWFKYADFFAENFNHLTGLSVPLLRLALPLGISFYTFQILSYLVDVFRGKEKPQHNFLLFAAYVSLFPQLIAGPIVRYGDLAAELKERVLSQEKVYTGLRRFLVGLAKKLLLANTLGELCQLAQNGQQQTVLAAWLCAVAYTMQIYFDFSGYSDMAIGLGRVLGFTLPENFHYPYLARSIQEFWRRWHITLGAWFRDYVYIPLGGSRVSLGKWVRNLLLVWGLTGLWHGAAWNFVLWGLLYGGLLMGERLLWGQPLERAPNWLRHGYVLLFVTLGFVLFQSESLAQAGALLGNLFGRGAIPLFDAESLYYLRSYGGILLTGVVGCTPLVRAVAEVGRKRWGQHPLWRGAEAGMVLLFLALSTACLVDSSYNPFLYFRF